MNGNSAATVLLRRRDGKMLMQLRDDGRGKVIPYPNMWNFPGGYIEGGETPLEAAIRETREEFEISIDPSTCRQIWSFTHDHVADDYVFLCPVPADAGPVLHEGAAFAWMTVDEIAKLALGFNQKKILPHIPH